MYQEIIKEVFDIGSCTKEVALGWLLKDSSEYLKYENAFEELT